jgi:hypothetical protein
MNFEIWQRTFLDADGTAPLDEARRPGPAAHAAGALIGE